MHQGVGGAQRAHRRPADVDPHGPGQRRIHVDREGPTRLLAVEQVPVQIGEGAARQPDVELAVHALAHEPPVPVEQLRALLLEGGDGLPQALRWHQQVEVGVGAEVGAPVHVLGQDRALDTGPRDPGAVEGGPGVGQVVHGEQVDEERGVVVTLELVVHPRVEPRLEAQREVDAGRDAVEPGPGEQQAGRGLVQGRWRGPEGLVEVVVLRTAHQRALDLSHGCPEVHAVPTSQGWADATDPDGRGAGRDRSGLSSAHLTRSAS